MAHKNPDRLYSDFKNTTQGLSPTLALKHLDISEEAKAEAARLAAAQLQTSRYETREAILTRRNLDPIWIENARVMINMYKQCGNDLATAAYKFKAWKISQGWDVTEKYVFSMMQYVREKLAIAGQADAMLEEQAMDLENAREQAYSQLEYGDVDPILKVIREKNSTFSLPKYYRDKQVAGLTVNINNQSNTQNVTVTKSNLDDYLKKLPADKRDAIKQLALEYRKDGSIPQSIDMKGVEEEIEGEDK